MLHRREGGDGAALTFTAKPGVVCGHCTGDKCRTPRVEGHGLHFTRSGGPSVGEDKQIKKPRCDELPLSWKSMRGVKEELVRLLEFLVGATRVEPFFFFFSSPSPPARSAGERMSLVMD